MAELKLVLRVDEKLIADGVIDKKFKADYPIVHRKLNSIVRKSGKILSEETFARGETEMRKWLMTLCRKGATQEKLTSYLRCALAHLSFDFIESSYRQIDPDDLVARTLVSFKKRKFSATFFKATQPEKKSVKKKTVKKSSKKTAKKSVKKAAKAKPVKRKVKSIKKKVAKKVTKKTSVKSSKKKGTKKRSSGLIGALKKIFK